MSFWKTFGFQTVSAIDTLMEGEYTLEQLLDEDEILQETKSQNRNLIDFLVERDSMHTLLDLVTQEPAEDADDARAFKHAYIAAEILCSDVWSICDAFFEHEGLLDKTFAFLSTPADQELPPTTTMYSARVAGSLLQKRTAEVVAFLQKHHKVSEFLVRLSDANVMELLLKLISSDDMMQQRSPQLGRAGSGSDGEGEGDSKRKSVLQWLREGDLIPSLVDKFSPDLKESNAAENAAQALVDIVVVSSVGGQEGQLFRAELQEPAEAESSPLVEQLETDAVAEKLFAHITAAPRSPALLHGLSVVIELLKGHVAQTRSEAKIDDPEVPAFVRRTVENLPKFCDFLEKDAPDARVFTLAGGEQRVPLGFHRLKLIELFAVMARLNYASVEAALISSNVFTASFKLCFIYKWNNFLHALIDAVVEAAMAGPGLDFKLAILRERGADDEAEGCGLLSAICDASDANEEAEAAGRMRFGFMGYVTRMADAIEASQETEEVAALVAAHARYQEFVAGPLKATREKDNAALAGYSRGEPNGGTFSFSAQSTASLYAAAASLQDSQGDDGNEDGVDTVDDAYNNVDEDNNHDEGEGKENDENTENAAELDDDEEDGRGDDGADVESGDAETTTPADDAARPEDAPAEKEEADASGSEAPADSDDVKASAEETSPGDDDDGNSTEAEAVSDADAAKPADGGEQVSASDKSGDSDDKSPSEPKQEGKGDSSGDTADGSAPASKPAPKQEEAVVVEDLETPRASDSPREAADS